MICACRTVIALVSYRHTYPILSSRWSLAFAQEAIEQYRHYQPHVTLMDLRLPDMSGIETLMLSDLNSLTRGLSCRRRSRAMLRSSVLSRRGPAGKKRISAQLAAQLAEHMSDEVLTEREVEVLGQFAGGKPQPGYRRAAFHFRRNSKGSHVMAVAIGLLGPGAYGVTEAVDLADEDLVTNALKKSSVGMPGKQPIEW